MISDCSEPNCTCHGDARRLPGLVVLQGKLHGLPRAAGRLQQRVEVVAGVGTCGVAEQLQDLLHTLTSERRCGTAIQHCILGPWG